MDSQSRSKPRRTRPHVMQDKPAPPPALNQFDQALFIQAEAALHDAGRRLSIYMNHVDGVENIKAVLGRLRDRLYPEQRKLSLESYTLGNGSSQDRQKWSDLLRDFTTGDGSEDSVQDVEA